MKPVRQNHDRGCFQAAIASILEMSLSDVPDFCAPGFNGCDWWGGFQTWLTDRGLVAVEVYLNERPSFANLPDGVPLIISGKSPRGEFQHSVCGTVRDGELRMNHDPHESGAGLEGAPMTVLFFAAMNPEKHPQTTKEKPHELESDRPPDAPSGV